MTNSQVQRTASPNRSPEAYRYGQRHSQSEPSSKKDGPPALFTEASTESAAPVPGFLGATSYSAVFTEGKSVIGIKDQVEDREINIRGSSSLKLPDFSSAKLAEGAQILELLADLEFYEPALERWLQNERVWSTIPFTREFIALVPPELKTRSKHGNQLSAAADRVFVRTSTSCPLNAHMTMEEYPAFLMGDNMSWETVGIILTIVGMSAISMDEVYVPAGGLKIDWKGRAQRLLRASDQCLSFCEEFGLLRDTGVHLVMLNFLLHTQVFGDADYHCWRKSGDVTTAIFAIGLHQEPTKTELPFFLMEIHKKLFWFAYISDKHFATFFGRPPLISIKYCSRKMPFELEFHQLGLVPDALDRALNELDDDGWNQSSPVSDSSWLKMAIMCSIIREQILELSLGTNSEKLEEQSRELKNSLEDSEKRLPLKFRDQPKVWSLDRAVSENYLRLNQQLEYIYNSFLLERTLVKRLRKLPTEIVKISLSLLSTLLVLTGNRHRLDLYGGELPWLIALYGLPSAGILALELLHHSRGQSKAASIEFPRSEIIQKLSNLVASIDFVVRPTNGNYVICSQAKKMLQVILDTVLAPEQDQPLINEAVENPTVLDSSLGEGLDDLTWLNTNLDLDFWTSLEDHPFLIGPDVTEDV